MSKNAPQQQVGNIQNQMNEFVNLILDRTSKTNFHTIVSSPNVTVDDFEKFGNLSYLLGLGFTNYEWNVQSLTQILTRLKHFNISSTILKNYFKIISNTPLEKFEEGKNKMANLISQSVENNYSLKNKIIKIIESSLIPINISPTISSRFIENVDEQLTFHDLIIFNNSFYTDFIVGASTSKAFISLSTDEEYRNKLQEASLNFDMQKFALIYIENIINIKAFLDNETNYKKCETFASLLDKKEPNIEGFVGEWAISDSISEMHKNSQKEEWIEKEDVFVKENNIEAKEEVFSNPEKELEIFLNEFQDYLKQENIVLDYKNNLNDLKTLLENLLTSEADMLQSFYMYLKQIKKNQDLLKNEENKDNPELLTSIIDINNILNFSKEEVLGYLNSIIKEYQDKYTKFINKYSSEIVEEDKHLLKMIDKIIHLIFIQNSEDKAILFSQLDINSIFTYKHLHQILLSIENQFISGFNIKEYNLIYTELKQNRKEIFEMFMNSKEIENLEVQIKLIYAFKNII